MNPQIKQLLRICQKPSRLILGLMSGTSLDGLDLALCRFEGSGQSTQYELLHFRTFEYPTDFKQKIQLIFAKDQIHFPSLSTLHAEIGIAHAQIIIATLALWGIKPQDVDVVASHGQTVMHRPNRDGKFPHSTLQIGDGDHIAFHTGVLTISDFRQKQVAAGGEGAPLAIFGDYLLFSKLGENRILLNIGGIGNFTFLPADGLSEGVLVTDTGPGNTLMDAAVQHYFPGFFYDLDGRLGQQGLLHAGLLGALMELDFFTTDFPKSTGPEYFNLEKVNDIIREHGWELTPTDLIRTLTEFSAQTIAMAIKKYVPVKTGKIYVSGGGSKNPLLVERLSALLSEFSLAPSDAIGIPADAKEAILFALLANETLMDDGANSSDRRLGNSPWVSMGKISLAN